MFEIILSPEYWKPHTAAKQTQRTGMGWSPVAMPKTGCKADNLKKMMKICSHFSQKRWIRNDDETLPTKAKVWRHSDHERDSMDLNAPSENSNISQKRQYFWSIFGYSYAASSLGRIPFIEGKCPQSADGYFEGGLAMPWLLGYKGPCNVINAWESNRKGSGNVT